MPWFVIDDNSHMHPKFVAAKNAALGLWVRAGGYAAQHLTDGIVPGVIAKMYGTPAQVRSLVAVGLWHEHGHTCSHPKCPRPAKGDYAIHDYLDYNPTRAEVQARREREADKKRRYRARAEQLPLGEPSDDTPPPPRPRRDEQQPIPADWQPSEQDVEQAQLARADAGLPQLTGQQLTSLTRRFVRRMTDDQVRAAAWGGRWQQWAERERTEPEQQPGGNVVPFGAMTKSQQQRAGLDRLAQRLNGGAGA
jgi:hypothetical protein